MKYIMYIFATVFTISCNTTKPTKSDLNSQNNTPSVLNGTYQLDKYDGKTDIPEGITLTFDSETQKLSGFAGCNSYFGTYSPTNTSIRFKIMGVSKKYCFDDTLNTFEKQFLDALDKEHTFTLKGNKLVLSGNTDMILTAATKKVSKHEEAALKIDLNPTMITYKAFSRGIYEHIEVSQTETRVSKDKNLTMMKAVETNADDWKSITQFLKATNLKTLAQLQPPSKKHLYDGAPHAILTIANDGNEIVIPTFDHGNPPKKIEVLVNKVLSMAKMVN